MISLSAPTTKSSLSTLSPLVQFNLNSPVYQEKQQNLFGGGATRRDLQIPQQNQFPFSNQDRNNFVQQQPLTKAFPPQRNYVPPNEYGIYKV